MAIPEFWEHSNQESTNILFLPRNLEIATRLKTISFPPSLVCTHLCSNGIPGKL